VKISSFPLKNLLISKAYLSSPSQGPRVYTECIRHAYPQNKEASRGRKKFPEGFISAPSGNSFS
jgi:hypothetical protein